MPTLSIRVDLRPGASIGPGKARLLELIAETGSISAAARAMEMSYRRAWLLIDDLKAVFGEAVVETAAGGAKGGGAHLTRRGRSSEWRRRLARFGRRRDGSRLDRSGDRRGDGRRRPAARGQHDKQQESAEERPGGEHDAPLP